MKYQKTKTPHYTYIYYHRLDITWHICDTNGIYFWFKTKFLQNIVNTYNNQQDTLYIYTNLYIVL